MLALVLLLGIVASVVVRDLNSDLDRAANVTARQQYLAGEINAGARGLANAARGSVLSAVLANQPQSQENLARFRSLYGELDQAIGDLAKLKDAGQDSAMLERLKQQSAGIREAGDALSSDLASQHMDQALKTFAEKLEPKLGEIGEQASSLVKQQSAALGKASQAAHDKSSRTDNMTIGLLVLALFAGGIVLWIVRQASAAFQSAAARLAKNAQLVSTAAADVSGSSQSLAKEAAEQALS